MNKRLKTQLLLATGALVGIATTTGLDQPNVNADEKVATTPTANAGAATTDQPTASDTNTATDQTTFQSPAPVESSTTDSSTPQAYGNAETTDTSTDTRETTPPAATTQPTETSQPTSSTTTTPTETTQPTTAQATGTVQQGTGSATSGQVDQGTQATQEAPVQQSPQAQVQESTPTPAPQAPVNNSGQASKSTETVNNATPAKSATPAKDQQKPSSTPAKEKQAKKSSESDGKQSKADTVTRNFTYWKDATGEKDERHIIARVTTDSDTDDKVTTYYELKDSGEYEKITDLTLITEIEEVSKTVFLEKDYLNEDGTEALRSAAGVGADTVDSYKIIYKDKNRPIPTNDEGIAIIPENDRQYFTPTGELPDGVEMVYVINVGGQYFAYDPDDGFDKSQDFSEEVTKAQTAIGAELPDGYTNDENIREFEEDYLQSIKNGNPLTEWKMYQVVEQPEEPNLPGGAKYFTRKIDGHTDYYHPKDHDTVQGTIITFYIDKQGNMKMYDSKTGGLRNLTEQEKKIYAGVDPDNDVEWDTLKGSSKPGVPEFDALKTAANREKETFIHDGKVYFVKKTYDSSYLPLNTVTFNMGRARFHAERFNYGIKVTEASQSFVYGHHKHYATLDTDVYTYAMNERYGVKVIETTPPGPEGPGGPETPGPGPSTPDPDPTPDPEVTPPTGTTPAPETPTPDTPTTPEDDIELPQALPSNDKKSNSKKKTSSSNKTGKTSTSEKDSVLYLKSNPSAGKNGSGSTGTGLQALNAKGGSTFKYSSNDAVKPASASTNATQKDQELKTASMLPQTGDTHTANWLAVLGLSMLGLLGLVKFRRRRD